MSLRDLVQRVALVVHALGLAGLVVALILGAWAAAGAATLAFVVGGVWAAAMFAQARAEDVELARQLEFQRRARFDATFDDVTEPPTRGVPAAHLDPPTRAD